MCLQINRMKGIMRSNSKFTVKVANSVSIGSNILEDSRDMQPIKGICQWDPMAGALEFEKKQKAPIF